LIDGSTQLTIDTTGEIGKVCLDDDCTSWQAKGNVEVLLEKIDELLRKHRLTVDRIDKIKINPGPGSFIGTRVGVAVANSLRWSLGKGKLIKPHYSAPAKITLKHS